MITNSEWVLPESGTLEFDYINLMDRTNPSDVLPQEKVDLLIEWFRTRHEDLKYDLAVLIAAFQSVAEYITLSSE